MGKYHSIGELKKGAVLLIDKPMKWTSFDAVNFVKVALRVKIGHCGTLDPLATGLLICCTGDMTKQISGYQQLPKEYTGIIHLGAITDTYDLESEPHDFRSIDGIDSKKINAVAASFVGDIMQVPPVHSAIKKDGKRSYELARSGQEFTLDARPVTIGEFEVTSIQLPEVHFRVTCSTGTYIRSLANDMGEKLGCGAYLQQLRRTKIGNFLASEALTPDQYKAIWKEESEKFRQVR